MAGMDNLDIWRQIPPEEKLSMMAKAQSKGIMATAVTIIILSTCAVGLRIPALLWGSMILSPIVYHLSTGKAWRSVKPARILQYLAARSAARRYAFMKKSSDLSCRFIFRGRIERLYDDENAQEAIEATIGRNKEAEVWIALFTDTIVIMSEKIGGAKLEFGHLINDKVKVEGYSPSGEDYASDKELIISYPEDDKFDLIELKDHKYKRIKVTSQYPAALIAFEKKIAEYRVITKANSDRLLNAMQEDEEIETHQGSDDFFS